MSEATELRTRRYGHMEPVVADLPVVRRFLSTDISCGCGAAVGEVCAGPRLCQERVQKAARLAREGLLAPAPEAAKPAAAPPCEDCGATKTARGRPMACQRPGHRCSKAFPTGRTCTGIAVRPGRYCQAHTPQPPGRGWNDGRFARV